ncbi:non-ribosomal peptide synthetase/MFS transporter [Microtetraspora niveoalba]|uniref:non-ribosomal peptide synthetase/MFS transporter n=1 Tax=Microtetraspora niveoalba TaxID=46175 RepID=UPI00082F4CEA|nr:non-ribosomal peptide synthetase/MFS transporter [Microtetraspora niveoalba]
MTVVSGEDKLRELLNRRIAQARRAAPAAIPRRTDDGPWRLSPVQRRMWLASEMERDSPAYNVPVALRLRGELDVDALRRAVADVVERHEVLRSTVEVRDGEPYAVTGGADGIDVAVEEVAPEAVEGRIAELARVPFRLAEEYPLRATLLTAGPREHVLLLLMHHIAIDAWSEPLLLGDLAAQYRFRLGAGPALDPPETRYSDVAAWATERAASPETERALDWWEEWLAGLEPSPGLLPDHQVRPGPPDLEWRAGVVDVPLAPETVTRLRALASETGATVFMVLLAALQATLARVSGGSGPSADVTVGVPESGRRHPLTESLVGCLVETLVVRGTVDGAGTGRELVGRARSAALDVFGHADVPFDRVVERVRPPRSGTAAPLFDVLLNVYDAPAEVAGFPGLTAETVEVPPFAAKFDQAWTFLDDGTTLRGTLTYRSGLYAPDTAARLAGWFGSLLDRLVAEPDRPVGELELEPGARHTLTEPAAPVLGEPTLHGRIAAQAARTPSATAVVAADGALTYAELDAHAERLAGRLRAAGVTRGDRVALLMERTRDLPVALLAVLRAGAAYVPIDDAAPADRIAAMVAAGGVRVAVCAPGLADRLPAGVTALTPGDHADDDGTSGTPRAVSRSTSGEDDARDGGAADVDGTSSGPGDGGAADGGDLAYVIFTSGSTGTPKGVAVEHRQVTAYLDAVLTRVGSGEAAPRSYALVSTIAADLGLLNVFGALTTGAALHVLGRESAVDPDAYAAWLRRHEVDAVKCVPSQLELLAAHGDLAAVLPRRLLVLAGEATPWTLIDRIAEARPDLEVQVHYGPTETTVSVLGCATGSTPRTGAVAPLGTPFPGVRCFVADPAGRAVPHGVAGELWIGGPQVARGYLGDPGDARYVERADGRYYRSGDRVRVTRDGVVEFLGRIDDQVKIRGYRVEPGEVAAACRALPGIAEAVVLPTGEGSARRLAAWLVPAPASAGTPPTGTPSTGTAPTDVSPAATPDRADEAATGAAPTAEGIRAALRRVLPDYMVPSAITLVEALPLNANGKVDRARLLDGLADAPSGGLTADGAGRAPETDSERLIAQIWAELLGARAAAASTRGSGGRPIGVSMDGSGGGAANDADGSGGAAAYGSIGAEADFFALGGDSFTAVRVAGRLGPALGVTVPLRLIFEHPVLADLAAALDALPGSGTAPAPAAIPRREGTDPIPLTPLQRQMWLAGEVDPDSAAYNVPVVIRFDGELDAEALRLAVVDLAERHEVLRSTVEVRDAEPYAVTGPASRVVVEVVSHLDTSTPGRRADDPAVAARLAELAVRPFRLAEEYPLRAAILVLGPREHVLALVLHHIASDAWSRGVLLRDLADLYAARTGARPAPAALDRQFADVAEWQRLSAEATDPGWWAAKLDGMPAEIALPADRMRPAAPGTGVGLLDLELPDGLAARVRALASARGATTFMVLLAGLQAMLARMSGGSDIAVAVPESGRRHPETERLVGCFLQTLVIRTSVEDGLTGGGLVERARAETLDAFAHAGEPLESGQALPQVLLNVYDAPGPITGFPGLAAEAVEMRPVTAKFDLSWTVQDTGTGLRAGLAYRPELFDEATARRMAGFLVAVLDQITADPGRLIGDLDLDPGTDSTLTGPRRTPLGGPTLHGRISAHAARTPSATAVVAADGTLTYGELEERAALLAGRLRAAGVERGDRVAVLMERTRDLPVAMLGALKAGAGYVPIDDAAPDDRIAAVLSTAGARVVVCAPDLAARVPDGVTAVVPSPPAAGPPAEDASADDAPGRDAVSDGAGPTSGEPSRADGGPVQTPPGGVEVGPEDLAYVIFTSGSTGTPKGVAVEHRNITAYLDGILSRLAPAGPLRSWALASTAAADLGILNVFGALTTGAALHLLDRDTATDPPAFAAHMTGHAVDFLKCVPSHLELLASHGDLSAVLPRRILVLAGEAVPWSLVDRIAEVRPDLEVQVHYGPTETTVAVLGCSTGDAPRATANVPLGLPLPEARCFVADRAGRALPYGVAGELWIGGPQVARGYLGHPEDPRYVTRDDGRWYRSGDRARVTSEGFVEFLGRIDDQVKIRGYRVEPGEVASVCRGLPGIAEAVVLPVGEGTGRRLAAWLVPTAPGPEATGTGATGTGALDSAAPGSEAAPGARPEGAPTVDGIRAALRDALPDYMVPSVITLLDAFPLNANGKVDRTRLVAELGTVSAGERVDPATGTERRVAEIWAGLLGLDAVGATDDFFALGGDSFVAVKAVHEIDEGLRVIDLFTNPTVRELAALLDGRSGGQGGGLLHRLGGPKAGGTVTATVVCVPYGGGSAAVYRPLAEALPDGVEVLALELPGHDPARPDEEPQPVEEVVERCVAELAARENGPISVYGHCVGTALATALALRLEETGVPVTGVFLGGSFPTARLPGKLSAWFNRRLPADRWLSDRAYRDVLRAMGGLPEDLEGATVETAVKALRHDARQAQAWFTRRLAEPGGHRLRAPVLVVIGGADRATELYEERYREWTAFADRVELAVIPNAGHYFLRHQADQLGDHLAAALRRWTEPGTAADEQADGDRSGAPGGARHTDRVTPAGAATGAPGDGPPGAGASAPAAPAHGGRTDGTRTGGASGQAAGAGPRGLGGFYTVALGQLVSMVGSSLSSFGLGVWTFQRSGAVFDFALVTMLALLPTVLVGPVGGAVADRYDRRWIMLVCDALNGLAMAAVAVLLWLDRLDFVVVCGVVTLTSVVTAFHRPAYLAAIAQLVPKPYLPQANALAQAGLGLGNLVAPLAGGALVALAGLPVVVGADVVTFAIAFFSLLAVRIPNRMFRRREESFRSAVAGGWRFFVRRPPLMVMAGYFMVVNYFTALTLAVVSPMVLSLGDAADLGVVTAVGGLGAVLGSVVMMVWGGTRRLADGMVGFVALAGLATVLVGVTGAAAVIPVIAVGLALRWGSTSVINAHWLSIIQLKVRIELQGRVLATNQMLATAMTPVGYLTAAPLTSWSESLTGAATGPAIGVMLAVSGVILAVWGVVGLRIRRLRHIEDELPDALPTAVISTDLDELQEEADRHALTR